MIKTTVEEVSRRLNGGDGRITIVDARRADAWESADKKAGGAIRIPPDEAEKHISDVRRDDYVVTYCTCPNEESSTRVAAKLEEHEITDVHPLEGGFDAWRDAGLPLEEK